MMNKKQHLFIRASYALILSFPCVSTCAWAAGIAPAPAATGSMPDTSKVRKDTVTIEEVEINAGYYTVKDRERTGSIARVTAKEIEKQPILNPLEALKGRMAGVDIQQQNGEIGAGFTVHIRGQNSLRSDPGVNDPLYLIDGVPFTSTSLQQPGGYFSSNPLNTLSPTDIASIEVLKDADATAIYGSRGANGVVLITTKQGQVGAASLTVGTNFGSGKVRKFMDLLDTKQYLEMRREAYANNPAVTPVGVAAADLLEYDQNKYTDWQKVLIGGTAQRSDARASLSGGNNGIRYLLSGGLLRQGNVYPGDFGYMRGNGHASLHTGNETDRFHAQLAITYSSDKNDMPNMHTNLTRAALLLPPNAPDMLDEQGNVNWVGTSYNNNPMAFLKKRYNQRQTNNVIQAMLGYRIMESLGLKVTAGYNRMRMDEEQLDPASSQNPLYSAVNLIQWKENALASWNIEPQLNYKQTRANSILTVLLGGTLQGSDQDGQSYTAHGFTSEALMRNRNMATAITAGNGVFNRYRYLSVFTRMNYAMRERYFINLTGRRDGSSRFGPRKRWGNFGAVGVAWLFTEENVMKAAVPWLNLGKLRASYGITGSDRIDDYGYMASYSISQARAYQIPYLSPVRISNIDYRWETNRKLEVALELGMLGDRIRTTVAWYGNRSGNQLVGYPLPAISGFTSMQYNLPAMVQNTGWEIELQSVNIRNPRFEWSTALNLSFPQRKLLSYPNIDASSYHNTYEVGESMDRHRRYRYLGVDAETGVYQFADLDGSGTLNANDFRWRDKYRIIFGGLQNSVRYRGINLTVALQTDKREREYRREFSAPGRSMENQPVDVMNRWQKPGDIKPVQQFWAGGGDAFTRNSAMRLNSDATLENVWFVRLSTVALVWQLPQLWCDAVGLSAVQVSANGQNLWVSDRRNQLDPETTTTLFLPPLRVITAGLQMTF